MATGHSDSIYIYIVRIGYSDSGDPDDHELKRKTIQHLKNPFLHDEGLCVILRVHTQIIISLLTKAKNYRATFSPPGTETKFLWMS